MTQQSQRRTPAANLLRRRNQKSSQKRNLPQKRKQRNLPQKLQSPRKNLTFLKTQIPSKKNPSMITFGNTERIMELGVIMI
jgi:hypothetical protein